MMNERIEWIRSLSAAFGPSGCEEEVRNRIRERITPDCDEVWTDRVGHLIGRIRGRGLDYHEENPRKLLLCASMDEVGFMIREITGEGYLKFSVIGSVDACVLCGRHVRIGDDRRHTVTGVIASKAIHLQSAEERKKPTPVHRMYIDIGARSREEAEKVVSVGDVAVFESEPVVFGRDGTFLKGKALDGRLGCAALTEILHGYREHPADLPYDLYAAFTCRGQIGLPAASAVAFEIQPECAVSLGTTEVYDLPDAPASGKAAGLLSGFRILLADKGTIYDKGFIRFASDTASDLGLSFVYGTSPEEKTLSSQIQTVGNGVRTLGLTLPVRSARTASTVVALPDYAGLCSLVSAMLENWKLD